MSNKQVWVTIPLSFVLLFTLIVGGWSYGILSSPASTGRIDITANMWFEMSKDGELKLQSVHLKQIQGEFTCKVLDLILLAVND